MLNIQLENGQSFPIRRLVLWVLAIIVIIIGVVYLFRYLSYGRLTVVTNSPKNIISVSKEGKDQTINSRSTIYIHSGNTINLKSGAYNVIVSNPSFSEQQIVDIQARQSKRLVLNLDKTTQIEPVSSIGARDMVVSGNQLLFIEPLTGDLYEYNNQNQLAILDSNHQFSNIEWADPTYGIGLDNSGNFYSINNGTVSGFGLPIPYTHSALTQYAVAPDKTLYIAVNNNIYKGRAGVSFTNIGITHGPVSTISASNQGVAFFAGKDEDTQTSKSSVASLNVLNSQTNKYKVSGYVITDTSWSPSGKYLATSAFGQIIIWDNALNKYASIPNNGASSLVWLDDNNLIYSQSSDIWLYNLNTKRSSLLGKPGNQENVIGLNISNDGAYLYVSVENQRSVYGLQRIGLKSQSIQNENMLTSLSLVLPTTLNGCSVNFLNFMGNVPTVIVQASASSEQQCMQQQQSYLNGYHIDSTNLQTQFLPN